MKMIVAVIQPFMLAKLTHALQYIPDFPGMTVTDVRGFGREKAHHPEGARHRVQDDLTEYVNKSRMEIVANDAMVEPIVELITRLAHTGNRGDGKIFVWPIESAVRIKTGETGSVAV